MLVRGVLVVVYPYEALATSMTCYTVGGSWSQPLVSLSYLHFLVTTGRRDAAFFSRIAMLLRIPLSREWSCRSMWGVAIGGRDYRNPIPEIIPFRACPCIVTGGWTLVWSGFLRRPG